jgi:hypothetical protein
LPAERIPRARANLSSISLFIFLILLEIRIKLQLFRNARSTAETINAKYGTWRSLLYERVQQTSSWRERTEWIFRTSWHENQRSLTRGPECQICLPRIMTHIFWTNNPVPRTIHLVYLFPGQAAASPCYELHASVPKHASDTCHSACGTSGRPLAEPLALDRLSRRAMNEIRGAPRIAAWPRQRVQGRNVSPTACASIGIAGARVQNWPWRRGAFTN